MNCGISLKGTPHRLSIPDLFLEYASKISDVASLTSDVPVPDKFDVCVVNCYKSCATLGLHQDVTSRTDRRLAVLSISLGDSADFVFKRSWKRGAVLRTLRLHSGDVVLFGGSCRDIVHGVTKIYSGTCPKDIVLPGDDSRLCITLRQR